MEGILTALNISVVDIFGLVVPGFLVALLTDAQLHVSTAIADALLPGVPLSPLLLVIAYAAVGYMIAMLFHTVSDLLERAMRALFLLDPVFWAGCSVRVDPRLMGDQSYTDINSFRWKSFLCRGLGGAVGVGCNFLILWYLLAGRLWQGPLFWLCFLLAVLVLPVLCLLAEYRLLYAPKTATPPAEAIPSPLLWRERLYNRLLALTNNTAPSFDEICANSLRMRSRNAWLQTWLVGKGNASKRTLFDGFAVMMRNTLWMMAAMQWCMSAGVEAAIQNPTLAASLQDSFLPQLFDTLHVIPSIGIVKVLLVLVMVLRFAQNRYLKYKYSFEDFLQLRNAEKKQAEEQLRRRRERIFCLSQLRQEPPVPADSRLLNLDAALCPWQEVCTASQQPAAPAEPLAPQEQDPKNRRLKTRRKSSAAHMERPAGKD